MTKHFCDRCNKPISEPEWFTALKEAGVYETWLSICNGCKKSYEDWWENMEGGKEDD